MQLKKNQHTVPQFYLRSFAENTRGDNYLIYSLKKETSKIIRPNVKNVAAGKYFYDHYQPQTVENYLSSAEADFARTFKKILSNKSFRGCNKMDRSNLSYFLYFQYIRTFYLRSKTSQILKYATEKDKSELIDKRGKEGYEKFKTFIVEKYNQILQKILIVLCERNLEFYNKKLNPNIIKTLYNLKTKILKHFDSLNALVLEIESPDFEFYTSDHPVVFLNEINNVDDGGGKVFLDIFNSFTRVYCPLSPTLCLMLYNKKCYDYKEKFPQKKQILTVTESKQIVVLNKLITHEAYRLIFAKSGDFTIAKNYLDNHPEVRSIDNRRFLK